MALKQPETKRYANEVAVGAPTAENAVPAQINRLSNVIDSLDTIVSTLDSKFGPVMRSSYPQPIGADETEESCQMAAAIQGLRHRIQRCNESLTSMLERCEL